MNFDALETPTSQDQRSLEQHVAKLASRCQEEGWQPALERQSHIIFLQKGLKTLPESFSSLESSRPWILYWITHSLALLEADLPTNVTTQGSSSVVSSQCSSSS